MTLLLNSQSVWETLGPQHSKYWEIQFPKAEVPFVLKDSHMYFSFFKQNPSPDQQIESFTMVLNFIQTSKPKKAIYYDGITMQLHHERQENSERIYKKSQAYSAFKVAQVFTQASLE